MRVYRALLRCYPPAFRARFGTDLVELFTDLHRQAAPRRVRFWWRIARDTMRHGLAERATTRRDARRSPFTPPPPKDAFMTTLLLDLRMAFRSFRSQPGFTAIVVSTLALGIGVTAAMFTIVNAVLLRPLPYDQPDRVVMLFERDPGGATQLVSQPAFEDWQSLTRFSHVALVGSQTANLTGSGEPDRLRAGFVTANFLNVLGVSPAIGRGFAAGEDRRGAPGVAILPHAAWETRFGSDPSILGRTLTLNNEPFQVIGILPRSFEFPFDDIEVYLPVWSWPGLPPPARGTRPLFALGRLADGVTIEEGEAELRQWAAATGAAYPDTNAGWSAQAVPFHTSMVRFVRTPLLLLMGAVVLVLLVACANVANLTLARGSSRDREMALRTALGAPRSRLVRQLLTESLLLAMAGGTLGLLASAAITDALLAIAPALPRGARVAPDGVVLVFTAGISALTGLVFGIVPALRTSRPDLRGGLQEGARATQAGGGRLRRTLVVAELALSLVLLAGAGLLAQSLYRLVTVDVGFRADRLLTMEYRLPRNKYAKPPEQWDVHRRILDRIAAVPGVESAALAGSLPFSGNGGSLVLWRAEDPPPADQRTPTAQYVPVTDRYFETMGLPLAIGRGCGPDDTPQAPLAIVVNQLLADRLWPGTSPVGRQVRAAGVPGAAVVVGVTRGTKHRSFNQTATPQVYGCFSQNPSIFATVAARTTGEPLALARSIQQAIWSVDPDQPMWKIRTMDAMMSASATNERFLAILMSAAAGLALALAALGVYGVMSYTVARRAREVGVRMALGASRGSILGLVLRESVVTVGFGLGLGVLGAVVGSRLLAAQLYEIAPRDPITLIVTAAILGATAIAASLLPALRAAGVDPVVTLRRP